ncbi:MAG: DNA repair protein RecO [Desulfovibrionaceae bacterium]|nr:DNA repair protein RecO [Desulfovibrionaceae bacterium]
MEWADTALVLRVGDFRESDAWVRLLSRKHGVHSAFAFGGRRSRRRFCGCLDAFNLLSCRCRSSRDGRFLTMQEAVLLRGPHRLRAEWRRMGLAVNCARFTEALGVGRESAPAAFGLFAELLELLESAVMPTPLLPLFFRLRLASDSGFSPNFAVCAACGSPAVDGGWFLVDEGQVRCAACGSARARYAVAIPAAGLDLLTSVQQDSLASWGFAQPAPDVRRACARGIDGFVQYHLGLAWDEGRFRRV